MGGCSPEHALTEPHGDRQFNEAKPRGELLPIQTGPPSVTALPFSDSAGTDSRNPGTSWHQELFMSLKRGVDMQ